MKNKAKKLIFVLSVLTISLVGCRKNKSDIEIGQIQNKENIEKKEKPEINEPREEIKEEENNKSTEVLDDNQNKRTYDFEDIEKHTSYTLSKEDYEKMMGASVHSHRVTNKEAYDQYKDFAKSLNKEDIESSKEDISLDLDNLFNKLKAFSEEFEVDYTKRDYMEDNPQAIEVANTLLMGYREEAFEMLEAIKTYNLRPVLKHSQEYDERNHKVEIVFVDELGEELLYFTGYYNLDSNQMSVRYKMKTDKYVWMTSHNSLLNPTEGL